MRQVTLYKGDKTCQANIDQVDIMKAVGWSEEAGEAPAEQPKTLAEKIKEKVTGTTEEAPVEQTEPETEETQEEE